MIHTIPITNSANGLAITPDNAFIYVAANGADGTEINVIETATNTVIATLAPSGTAQFLAVTPNGKFVYLTNDRPSVDVIDTNTNTVSSIITVGSGAEGIAVAPNGLRVYVANTTSNNVSVIDANPTSGTYNQVVATVTVGTAPEQVAVTPDSQFVYVTNLLDNTVSVIDTSTNTVTNVVTVGAHPRYVAIGNTPSGINAYVGNSTANTISVINTANPSVVAATITLSTGNDVKPIAITPDGLTLLVANGNSILTVIDTANNTELANQTLGSIPNFIVMSNFIPPLFLQPLCHLQTSRGNCAKSSLLPKLNTSISFSGAPAQTRRLSITFSHATAAKSLKSTPLVHLSIPTKIAIKTRVTCIAL